MILPGGSRGAHRSHPAVSAADGLGGDGETSVMHATTMLLLGIDVPTMSYAARPVPWT